MHNKHASYIPPSESALQFRAPLPRIADTHFADSYVRQIDMSTEKAARLVHRAGGLDNSMISQDVVSAAERHKNAAPGARPGVSVSTRGQPRRGERFRVDSFAPSGAGFDTDTNPGLTPGAMFLRRSAAKKNRRTFRCEQTPRNE